MATIDSDKPTKDLNRGVRIDRALRTTGKVITDVCIFAAASFTGVMAGVQWWKAVALEDALRVSYRFYTPAGQVSTSVLNAAIDKENAIMLHMQYSELLLLATAALAVVGTWKAARMFLRKSQ